VSKTIDMTPSWSGVLPILLAAYSNKDYKAIDAAQQELKRMAELADLWVDYSKALEPMQAEKNQAESVQALVDFIDSHPVGRRLNISTGTGGEVHRGEVFDWHTNDAAVKSVIAQGLITSVEGWRSHQVTVVTHSRNAFLEPKIPAARAAKLHKIAESIVCADSVANDQPQSVKRASASQKVRCLMAFVNIHPVGTVLEISDFQYAGDRRYSLRCVTDCLAFDYRTNARAVRAVIGRGLLKAVRCWGVDGVEVVAHSNVEAQP